jgi:hypothetical protein
MSARRRNFVRNIIGSKLHHNDLNFFKQSHISQQGDMVIRDVFGRIAQGGSSRFVCRSKFSGKFSRGR